MTGNDPPHEPRPIPTAPLLGHPRYEQVKFIARGSYGFVLLALDRETNTPVALKFIERGVQITKYVEREILNQLRLRHPHIIALKEVFLTDDYLVLAMEYAPGGDLFKVVSHLRGLSEDNARWFFQQIVLAMDYCHRMGVANRDIKLENTLLDSSVRPLVKLADFGFSKDENYQSAPGSRVGTPAYLAPEVITNVHGQSYDAKKADVWSCGVLLFITVTGRYPFRKPEDEAQRPAQRLHAMLQRILSVSYSFPSDLELSEPCKNLISSMLVADPSQRPSVQQVLHHPWVAAGMEPAMFQFNDSIVASSLANQPPPQLMMEIQNLVREAQHLPPHVIQAQAAAAQAQAQQGSDEQQVLDEVPDFDPADLDFLT